MKKIILILFLSLTFYSCGKSNKVNSTMTSGTSSLNTYSTAPSNFEGNYDLIEMKSNDCDASIQIIKDCDGFKLLSNYLKPEEFCNINRGEINSKSVTLHGNELKSIIYFINNPRSERDARHPRDTNNDRRHDLRIPQNNVNLTSSLLLNADGTLIKTSNLNNKMSHCVYLRR